MNGRWNKLIRYLPFLFSFIFETQVKAVTIPSAISALSVSNIRRYELFGAKSWRQTKFKNSIPPYTQFFR